MRKFRVPALCLRILLTAHFCLYAVTPIASSLSPENQDSIARPAPVLKLFALETIIKTICTRSGPLDAEEDSPRILMRKRLTAVRPTEDIQPPTTATIEAPGADTLAIPQAVRISYSGSPAASESDGHDTTSSGLSPPLSFS